MTIVVYSNEEIDRVDGITYRKLNAFYGVVSGATAVYVEGGEESIVQAYEDNGVTILDELPTSVPVEPGETVNWNDIAGKPDLLKLGAKATEAAAGNHDHKIAAHTASGLKAAATVQAALQDVSTRVKALEDASAE